MALPEAWAVNTALLLSVAGTKSALTTPPVTLANDQLPVAATFAMKFPEASLSMVKTVTLVPDATSGPAKIVPRPFAAFSIVKAATGPGPTVNVPEFPVRLLAVAVMTAVPVK
jgi:hypothetical protein